MPSNLKQYSRHLKYTINGSQQFVYNSGGQGQLDINEMLASRPCWREFEMGVKEAPKTLILADWSASLWSDEEIAEKKQKLSQMLRDGFQLFIVQEGELIPLEDINSLDDYKVRKGIIPSSAENLINNAINKHNLTRDQILVLDQASIHLLNQEELPETQTIRIDLRTIYDSVKRHQLFESLAKLSPPIRNIIFFADYTSQEKKYSYLEPILKRQLPNTNISFVTQEMNGKDEFVNPGMLRMRDVEMALAFEDPLKIDILIFDDDEISPPEVEQLFKKYSHAKRIHTNNSPIDLSLYETPFLQSLHMRQNSISQKAVENLLNKNTSLQYVNLVVTCYYESSDDGPLSIVNQLPELETFTLHARSSLSLKIAELLDCAKNLKHLTLGQIEILFAQSEKLPTLALESLEITIDANKDFENLMSLLEKMPHLTKLSLKNSPNITLQQLKTVLQRFPNIISFDFVELNNTRHPYFAFFSDPELMSLLKNRLILEERQHFGKYEPNSLKQKLSQAKKEVAEKRDATEKKPSSSTKPKQLPKQLKDEDFIRQASTFTKTAQDFQFEFDADKDTNDFNQMNVINAVSQYILLTGQPHAWLPQINDGICQALSELYATTDSNEWSDRLQKLIRWDGTANTLDDSLRTTLDSIMARVTAIYSPERKSAPRPPIHYLGDNIDSFISSLREDKKNVAIYLRNAGHRIAIKYNADQDFFEIYDPNHKKGIQIIPCSDANFLKTVGHQLHQALGPQISYIKLTPNQQLPEYSSNNPIRNYEHFIKNNGLLNVIFNPTLLKHVSVFKIESLPKESLSGILLRDVSGIPAWFSGIRSANEQIKKYTFDLLSEFIRKDPDYYKKIQKSLENATSMQKHAAIEAVLSLYREPGYRNNSSYKQLLNELPAIIRTTPHTQKHYELQFNTWQNLEVFNKPLDKFCEEVVGADKEKQLIELESSEEIHGLRLALESQCIDNKRPVFYVNSPRDLVCSSPTVHRGENNEGIFETEFPPGTPVGYGPLYDFLMANKDKDPVIIVNYEQFKADDMVKFNSLLDKKRVIDGVPVPETTSIIGLVNKKNPNSYHGSDFYSRFGKENQQKCPVAKEELKNAVLPLPFVNQPSSVENAPVETLKLYHAKDWKEKLLGQWKIAGEQLTFVPGQLPDPILPNTVFEIENGLWELPEFKQFWEEALVRGEILSHGKKISAPKNIHSVKKEGYSWEDLQQSVQWPTEAANDAVCINPSNVSQLFYRYQCNNDTQQLNTLEGLIEKAAK